MLKKPLINNQIRSPQARVIDEAGKQIGVLDTNEAIRLAQEKGLDLIQVSEKTEPPVCRIMDYGKFLYREGKKNKPVKSNAGEMKGIRLRFGISPHDLEIRANQTEKFFKKGYKVKIDLVLRGREKALGDFAKEKVNQFLKILQEKTPILIERELKREQRGFTMIISKGITKSNNEKESKNQKIDSQKI
ncbi:MAG: translation initiation factor IF-3 [bacterium]